MRNILTMVFICFLLLIPLTGEAAATILRNCFDTPGEYTIQYEHELSSKENKAGENLNTGHLLGTGPILEANCSCPSNLTSDTKIYEKTFAGSPLNPGTSGYGVLTENLDINVSGYSDAINNPDGSGLYVLNITKYPTTLSSSTDYAVDSKLNQTEGTADVCSNETRPSGYASVKRQFKWNVIAATIYIKNPILGEEIIPSTLVVQNYACLYFGSGSNCTNVDAQLVSNIWLSGKITAPLSCTINAGSTIEVDLGTLNRNQFVTPGATPQNYTLRNVDISYHCDGLTADDNDKIKLTLTADQGVVDGSQSFIARLIGRDDLGVRMFDVNNQNVVLDGSTDFPVSLDEQGNGVIRMKAAPVSTTASKPAPGSFEGNMTVKMDLR